MPARLDDLPRVRLGCLPTPVLPLDRLAAALGGPRLVMKRDDMTGLAFGGNKTRKLEFLLGRALAGGCDAVVTGGAAQSNHCRQTAAAAAATGLECHLALGGEAPATAGGNLLLDHLLGAVVHWCGGERRGERVPEIADELGARGRRPYVVPYGGSDAAGAVGFVAAAFELAGQLAERGERVDRVVIASSSGGTQAGLAVGLDLAGLDARLTGIVVDKRGPGEPPYDDALADLANQVAREVGAAARYAPGDFDLRDGYLGGGYGVVGDLEREAIALVARREGILLDPVYTGRAMGGLVDLVRRGEVSARETVLFWHTGGTPALFEYARDLAGR